MTEPKRDDAELYRVFDYARNHPENWDQRYFSRETDCGTTYCIAGFKRFVFDGVTPEEDLRSTEPTGHYAARKLGLNEDEASALFYEAGTHEQVEDTVKRILNDEYREK